MRKLTLLIYFSISLILLASKPTQCLTISETRNLQDQLKEAAKETYLSLLTYFKNGSISTCDSGFSDSCNYWQLGNSFDTIIDYLVLNPEESINFGDYVIATHANAFKGNLACWYDDYGWWAVASQRSLLFPNLFSSAQQKELQNIANISWNFLQTSNVVWENCEESETCKNSFFNLEPMFNGGCWNWFWTTSKIDDKCSNACNPNDQENRLCGIQNTVTNMLYASAAALRVKSHTNHPMYDQDLNKISSFLSHWMNFEDSENSIIRYFSKIENKESQLNFLSDEGEKKDYSKFVFRERVGLHKDKSQVLNYNSKLSWAGDNGLALGFYVTNPKEFNIELIKKLLLGIKDYFVINDSVLYPWANDVATLGPSPGNDNNDYNLGISVFFRNLLTVYQKNSELKEFVIANFGKVILSLTQNVLSGSKSYLCYPSQFDCTEFISLTNKLSILNFSLNLAEEYLK